MKNKYFSSATAGGAALACALVLAACGRGEEPFPDQPIPVRLINVTEPGLKLRLNGGSAIDIKPGTAYQFEQLVTANTAYKVELVEKADKVDGKTVYEIPANAKTCTVFAGEGNVSIYPAQGIVVSCELITYALEGTITGPHAGLVINNGSGTFTVPDTETRLESRFTLPPVAAGVPYSVTILKQPTGKTCTVSPAQADPAIAAPVGTMPKAPVTNLNIKCA